MRITRVLSWAALLAASSGCLHNRRDHVEGGELGRVVIYRNGVAFYERHAEVTDGRVTVRVPRDKVDDFLKSLTIVDRASGKPLAVTIPRREADDGSYLTMTLETPIRSASVLLTYVTEAPAWKPSYRVVVGGDNKVMLEGWAIVDNTTSEDWNKVLVGVGASSALAFRYDLWSVRQVDRDLLQGEDRFAVAPPAGVSPYDDTGGVEELANLAGSELRTGAQGDAIGISISGSTSLEQNYVVDGIATTGTSAVPATRPGFGSMEGVVTDHKSGETLAGVTVVATSPVLRGEQAVITDDAGRYYLRDLPRGTYQLNFYYGDGVVTRSNIAVAIGKSTAISQKLKSGASHGEVIAITGNAPMIDQSSTKTGTTITRDYRNIPVPGRTFEAALGAAAGSTDDGAKPPPPVRQGDVKLNAIVGKLIKDKRDVVVEVAGRPGDDKQIAERGNAVKNKLVNDGVAAGRIRIVSKVGAGNADTVRVLAVKHVANQAATAPPTATQGTASDTPVGESHFMAERPMTVRAGTSAMVAMVHRETTGGVVYLFDPIADRGDQRFAFKSVRLDNPTQDTLEPGPVTVYGDGRFIGEGITEPVPPGGSVVVPFALDKQVVVTRTGSEDDRIAKLVTVQRGVINAELQHRRSTEFTVTSRLSAPATVYLRHRLETGWTLVEAPSRFTRVGDSQLFEIRLEGGETKHVAVLEATPVQRTFDLSSPEALGMMKVFIDEPNASPQLKDQIAAMLATHRGAADLVDRIATLREQLVEYRQRSGELHAQLVTLKAVRTGGELMSALRQKLAETSDRVQKTTIQLVETQEKLMLARVKFQNQLAELRLADATKPAVSAR